MCVYSSSFCCVHSQRLCTHPVTVYAVRYCVHDVDGGSSPNQACSDLTVWSVCGGDFMA